MVQPLGRGTLAGRGRPRLAQLGRVRPEIAMCSHEQQGRAAKRGHGDTQAVRFGAGPVSQCFRDHDRRGAAQTRIARSLGGADLPRHWFGVLIERIDFKRLARWRGEPSPKLVSAIGEEAALGIKLPPGWSAWRFEGRSWPKDDAFVYLIETRTRMITGWIIAGSCLLAWLWCGRRLARRRFIVLASVMALCLLVGWLLPSRYASYIAAVYLAALGLLVDRARPRLLAATRVGSRAASFG